MFSKQDLQKFTEPLHHMPFFLSSFKLTSAKEDLPAAILPLLGQFDKEGSCTTTDIEDVFLQLSCFLTQCDIRSDW